MAAASTSPKARRTGDPHAAFLGADTLTQRSGLMARAKIMAPLALPGDRTDLRAASCTRLRAPTIVGSDGTRRADEAGDRERRILAGGLCLARAATARGRGEPDGGCP